MNAGIFAGRKGRARRETLTAYLFLLPSILLIFVFGLWPVVHAGYVSLHKWNIKPKGSQCLPFWSASLGFGSADALEQTDCLGLNNYVELLGLRNLHAILGTIAAVALGWAAYSAWQRASRSETRKTVYLVAALLLVLLALFFLVRAVPGWWNRASGPTLSASAW